MTALKSYKAHFVQELDEEDFHNGVDTCKILIPMLEDNDTQESFFFRLSYFLFTWVSQYA